MKCQDFEAVSVELVRGELIQAGVRDAGLAHAASCERCSARIADQRSLTLALGVLSESRAGCEAPARVESMVLAAFRESKRRVSPASSARPARWRPLGWAAAAVATVVLSVGASVWLQSRSTNARLSNDSQSPLSQDKPSPALNGGTQAAIAPVVKSEAPPRRISRANHAARRDSRVVANANSRGEAEITTDFIPVSYEQVAAGDGLQLVRVELPRSALASFGLPVNVERASQPIKADVLLGHDGVARAIRFVH